MFIISTSFVPMKRLRNIYLTNMENGLRKATLTCSLLLVAFTGCEKGIDYASSPTTVFEALWQELDEKYCFFDYKAAEYGLDWDEVHRRYAAQVNDSLTNRQLFDVLSAMVGELRDGHTNLIGDYYTSYYTSFYSDYPSNFDGSLISHLLAGREYDSGDVAYGILPDSVGYMYIGSFSSSFSTSLISELFRYFADCKGLIVDVRSNGGGDLDLEQSLVARFMTEESMQVGYMCHKVGKAHDAFSAPIPVYVERDTALTTWTKPVCVLANRHSYSATNDFVRNMRLLPQVTIVGDRTGGGSGLPMSTELPNGWSLRYSSSPMFDIDMNHTEFGIDPDVFVALADFDRQRGVDTIIEAARRIIHEEE